MSGGAVIGFALAAALVAIAVAGALIGPRMDQWIKRGEHR